jgi:hypothetical protein
MNYQVFFFVIWSQGNLSGRTYYDEKQYIDAIHGEQMKAKHYFLQHTDDRK